MAQQARKVVRINARVPSLQRILRIEAMSYKALLFCVLALVSTLAIAAPSPVAKKEIGQLMNALSRSGCKFQRNGDWYDPAEARAHLQRKYDYLLKKDKVDTAEQFIRLAASKSSMSGRPYRVDCKGREQDSSTWFHERLLELRRPAAAGAAS